MEDKLNDKWINIEEAAEYLGVKPVTLRGWKRQLQLMKEVECLSS